MASASQQFVGRWRILSMDVWDDLDLVVPAFIEFDRRNGGAFQFLAVSGDIDYRVSTENETTVVEWSWLGDDDGQDTGGRGWAVREKDKLVGHFFIHGADDSAFVAMRHARRSAKMRGH
jgi:hypothetical protein